MRKISNKNKNLILYKEPILKGILIIAIPVLLNNILRSLNDFVDSIMITRADMTATVEQAISGINMITPVYSLFSAIGLGLSIALVAIASQYLGANKKSFARAYASKIMFLMFVFGGIMTCLGLVLAKPIANAIGVTGQTATIAISYFQIRSVEFIFYFMFLGYQAVRQAEGKTILPVIINVLSIGVNILFTYIFVFIFKWNIYGAAWATVISTAFMFPFVIFDIILNKKYVTISYRTMIPNIKSLKMILRLAFPAFVATFLNSLGFIFIQSFLIGFGENVASGFGLANKLSAILSNALLAISTVLTAFVGNNIGNKNYVRAKKSYKSALIFMFVVAVLISSFALLVNNYSISFLSGPKTSDAAVKFGEKFAFWLFLTQPLLAFIWCDQAYFNGSGHSFISSIINLVRLWIIRIPLLYIFKYLVALKNPEDAIWIAMLVSNVLIIIVGFILRKKTRLNSFVEEGDEKSEKDSISFYTSL